MTSFPINRAAAFLFFVLAAGILFYFFASGINESVDPVSLLPGKTAVLVDIKEPAKDMDKLRRSKLGKQINSINWRQILHEIGVQEEYINDSITAAREFDLLSKSYVFNELFGNRVLFGLIPFTSESSEQSFEKTSIEKMVVLIARPKHPASLVLSLIHI